MPVWEPRGENVTYLSNRNGNFDVWSKRADGVGEPELLLDLDVDLFKIEWSPDGEWLLLQTVPGDVLGYRPGESAEPIPLLAEAHLEREPEVSRDGRWLAYVSNETGRNEIYVRPFPDVNAGRWQVSSQTGRNPRWAHSGRELYFVEDRAEAAMWVVGVQAAASFAFDAPVLLFGSPGQWSGAAETGQTYDIAPDDQRFLIGRRGSGTTTGGGDDGVAEAPTVLVNNFFEELVRLVP
jgi:serine/threonine-protein kinase